LKGGIKSWIKTGKEIDTIETIDVSEFEKRFKASELKIFDVRKESEFQSEHVEGALNTQLDYLNDHLASIPKEGEIYLHCAGGYRSMIAASILKARGWDNVVDVNGGLKAIKDTDIPITAYVCPSTLK
jgi:rhodanese-related sulfurtransferase